MLRNVFFLCLISVLKCQVLLLHFHPDFDRCSSHNVYVYRGFAVLFCFFLSCEHIQRVLCLQGSSLLAMTRQTVSRTDCVIHMFIYLTKASVKLHILDSSPSYQVDFLWGFLVCFLFFCVTGRTLWKCCDGKRLTSLPHELFTMSCCHVASLGEKKKYFFGDRSGVVNSVFQLAFVSLCRRRKKVLKGAFCFIFFDCSTKFIFLWPKVTATVSHFSLWPSSQLKKVLLVAVQAVQYVCVIVCFALIIVSYNCESHHVYNFTRWPHYSTDQKL